MKKKQISCFFVQLAMMAFLMHAIVPHCHHDRGETLFFVHHHLYEFPNEETHHHDGNEPCTEASHHGMPHHADHNEDKCVLQNPFDNIRKANRLFQDWGCALVQNEIWERVVAPKIYRIFSYPTDQIERIPAWFMATFGFRAPPAL